MVWSGWARVMWRFWVGELGRDRKSRSASRAPRPRCAFMRGLPIAHYEFDSSGCCFPASPFCTKSVGWMRTGERKIGIAIDARTCHIRGMGRSHMEGVVFEAHIGVEVTSGGGSGARDARMAAASIEVARAQGCSAAALEAWLAKVW